MKYTVGIIGFGTVGAVLADIFHGSGTSFCIYDVLQHDDSHKQLISDKAKTHHATLLDLPELIESSTYVISTVTTQVAEAVAKQCVPLLRNNQYFVDCNSTSPGIKIRIGEIIQESNARFIEGVILNAVNPGNKHIEMLIGGQEGEQVTAFLKKNNINARFYSVEPGKASMFKMLRSIFSKGVEVLLLEMMIAAKKAGIETNLWTEITAFMDSKPFQEIGETWMKSHAVAYERRYYEMKQVIDTMQELGSTPVMSSATLECFRRSIDANLGAQFSIPPDTAAAVVDAMAKTK